MKNNLIIMAMLCYALISCHKDRIEEFQSVSLNSQSLETEEGSEGLMEFAPATPNPYTLANMRLALNELYAHNQLDCDTSIFNIRVTHKYIKFIPADSSQYEELIDDTTLILFDYPLDRKLTKAGTYYIDSSLAEGHPNYQWTCVLKDKELPDVPYEVLAELYLPEEDPELTQYEGADFDDCITLLIDEALKLTGNFDTSSHLENMTSGGELSLSLPSKWTPSGRIRVEDDVLETRPGLQGVVVRVRRWFEIRESITEANGNFNVGHQFRYPVNYSIKWERKQFNIRSGNYGQAYFNGPENKGAWNLDIVKGFLSFAYANVHRGAYTYYYNNTLGTESPTKNTLTNTRIEIGVFDENGRAEYKCSRKFKPEIFIYKKGENGNIRSSKEIFQTTVHELTHSAHYEISHWHYNNTDDIVLESWAVGVAYYLTLQKYPIHTVDRQDHALSFIISDLERKYTPLVIDLIDTVNQRAKHNGNTNFPLDNVSGYTIKQVENALKKELSLITWRNKINTLYNIAPPSDVNDLFQNYINIQP